MLRSVLIVTLPLLAALAAAAPKPPLELAGTLGGRHAVRMRLRLHQRVVVGAYQYVRVGRDLSLKGTRAADGQTLLVEYDRKGRETGRFQGVLAPDGRSFTGTWSRPDGTRPLPFTLGPAAAAPAAAAPGPAAAAAVTVEPITLVLKHPKGRPAGEEATVRYPRVVGLKDRAVAAKVEALLRSATRPPALLKEFEGWLEEVTYEVTFNTRGILDLDISFSGVAAYPSGFTEHYLIDLTTGERITAARAFATGAARKLVALLNGRLAAEIAQARKTADADCRDVPLEGQFTADGLDGFSVSEAGLTFGFDYSLPHVAQACAPAGRFALGWQELRPFIAPAGPLAQFVK
jgi:hypothetical protein